MKILRLFVFLFAIQFSAQSFAADTTPPLLINGALSSTNIDVSNSNQTILVTLSISEDLSGFAHANITFVSPSKDQQLTVGMGLSHILSGNALSGVFTNRLVIPRYAETGLWSVQEIEIRDNTSNTRTLSYGSLLQLGIRLQFNLAGITDVSPPQFQNFSFSPITIDADSSNRTVNFSIHVTDDLSGISDSPFDDPVFSNIHINFRSPSGRQNFDASFTGSNRMSGEGQNGVYTNSTILPESAERGIWVLQYLDATDQSGNHTFSLVVGMPPIPPSFPLYLTVTGSSNSSDLTPPTLVDFGLSLTNVNTSFENQTILLTAHITDDISGLGIFLPFGNGPFVNFVSPSGNQSASCAIAWVSTSSSNGLDAVFTNSLVIPKYSETGLWTLGYVTVYDAAFNQRQLTIADMQGMGFPFSFTVEEFPTLKLTTFGDLLLISWPKTIQGFTLQTAASLPGSWSPVSNSPIQLGDELVVILPMLGEKNFFRLKK